MDVDFTDGVDCNPSVAYTNTAWNQYSIVMPTSQLEATRAITTPPWQSPRVCMWVWCTGNENGFVYADVHIDPAAAGFPTNPNPSGVRTCGSSNLGPLTGSGALNQVGVQTCVEAAYWRAWVQVGVPSGSTVTWRLNNPVGHYFRAFLMQGASCDRVNAGGTLDLSTLAAVQSITGGAVGYSELLTATLTGTCTSGTTCCVAMDCRNNQYYDGVCASMTTDFVVATPLPASASGTAASTRSLPRRNLGFENEDICFSGGTVMELLGGGTAAI